MDERMVYYMDERMVYYIWKRGWYTIWMRGWYTIYGWEDDILYGWEDGRMVVEGEVSYLQHPRLCSDLSNSSLRIPENTYYIYIFTYYRTNVGYFWYTNVCLKLLEGSFPLLHILWEYVNQYTFKVADNLCCIHCWSNLRLIYYLYFKLSILH